MTTARSILILGGSSDIGLAIAHRFAAERYAVMLAGRDPSRLERDAEDIRLRHRAEVSVHRYDVLELADAEAFFAGFERMPRVIVSVVGLLGDQDEAAGDPETARRVVETNFLGPAWAMEAAARVLEGEGGGTVVGVSSVAGDRGRARNYWYGAAKAGFSEMLSGLRQKHARGKVHVLTVKPGFVATRMTQGMGLSGPLVAQPEEVGEAVWRGVANGANVIHVRRIWRLVMAVITHLPEAVFKRTRF